METNEPHNWANIGEGMCDKIECSCGWKSQNYFDGFEYAVDEYEKHLLNVSKADD